LCAVFGLRIKTQYKENIYGAWTLYEKYKYLWFILMKKITKLYFEGMEDTQEVRLSNKKIKELHLPDNRLKNLDLENLRNCKQLTNLNICIVKHYCFISAI